MSADSAFSGPSIELYHETPNIYEKPDAALDASAYVRKTTLCIYILVKKCIIELVAVLLMVTSCFEQEQPVSSLRETYEWGVIVPTMVKKNS